jgi:hypothetical protein
MYNRKAIPKMTKQIVFLIILTIGLSCKNRQESIAKLNNAGSETTEIKAKENIRFDFKSGRINTLKETIEIKASLFNDNTDTIYLY